MGFEKGVARNQLKRLGFKKVLGFKVSRQGKLEFESDLSKMLITHKTNDDFAKLCSRCRPAIVVVKRPIKLMK